MLVARVLSALLAAGVSLGLALASAGFWEPRRSDLLWLLLLAAAVAFVGSSATAVREFRAPRAERHRTEAATVLWVAFDDISDLTGIQGRSLGIAAYRLRRRTWVPWRQELVTIHRVRVRDRTTATTVRWAPGKGVLGLAVSRGEFTALDVAAAWAPLAGCSQGEWEAQPDDVRLGLTHREFQQLAGKHGTVVAAPIIGPDGDVRGCVVVDAPTGYAPELTTLDVQRLLADTALSIDRAVLS